MQETLWEIACDEKGYMYSENGNRPRRRAAAVVVSWSAVQPATTKLLANVFVFKSGSEKEGLPRTSIPPWAQEISGSNRDAPTTNSLN